MTIISRALFLLTFMSMSATALAVEATETDIDAPSSISLTYDPFTGDDALVDFPLRLFNSGAEPKAVVIEITPEFGTEFELDAELGPLPIILESGSIRATEDQLRVPVTLGPGERIEDIRLRIPSGQVPESGSAEQVWTYHLLDALSLEPITALRTVTVLANIPARAQSNFAGVTPGYLNGTSNATVDFGQIEKGASRRIVLQVRANTEALIAISSENNGAMVLEGGTHRIEYELALDGQICDLTLGCDVTRNPERTLDGSAYPMEFTLSDSADLFAGDYRDIVVVDINPL